MNNKRPIHELSIFGGYKYLEDQATAALLHILDLGGHHMIEYVFEDVLSMNDIEGYTISAQPYYNTSRPDGEIFAHYHLVIESKVNDWTVNERHNKEQLNNHLNNAQNGKGFSLVYILNQQTIPNDLENAACFTTTWDDVISRLKNFVNKRTFFNKDLMSYLIEQLDILIKSKSQKPNTWKNIPQNQRVVVVGGRWGEEVALKYGFYACQYDRKFQSPAYIAFYHKKRIKYVFRITSQHGKFDNLQKAAKKFNFDFRDYFVNKDPEYLKESEENKKRQFFVIEKVYTCDPEIKHEEAYAYVQKQRYTSIDALKSAKTTRDLQLSKIQ